jgi:hypothetical protein
LVLTRIEVNIGVTAASARNSLSGGVKKIIPIATFLEVDRRFVAEPPPEPKREYVRFAVGCQDEDRHVEQGTFQAAALALEWQNITGSDADELTCLPAPDCGFCVHETGAAPFKLSSPVIARF